MCVCVIDGGPAAAEVEAVIGSAVGAAVTGAAVGAAVAGAGAGASVAAAGHLGFVMPKYAAVCWQHWRCGEWLHASQWHRSVRAPPSRSRGQR